jgi:hypothetical protein
MGRSHGGHCYTPRPPRAATRFRIESTSDQEKEFTAGQEDRTSPDVKKWVIQAPAAGSHNSLVVTAEKSLDQALFARLLRVEDSRGHRVPGEASIEADETRSPAKKNGD